MCVDLRKAAEQDEFALRSLQDAVSVSHDEPTGRTWEPANYFDDVVVALPLRDSKARFLRVLRDQQGACVMYAPGVSYETGQELAYAAAGCTVHTFDCTMHDANRTCYCSNLELPPSHTAACSSS